MRDIGHLSATRQSIAKTLATEDELPADGIRVPAPQDVWHVAILRESDALCRYARKKTQEVVQQYETDIRAREQSAGRVIEPSFPVQLSGRVIEVARIIEDVEERFDAFIEAFEKYENRAASDTNTRFEDSANSHLELAETLIERTRLYLHAYLWILWTIESLEQANQFAGILQNPDRYSDWGEGLFAYIAHPSLAVATISCTAMIEEVGAVYINDYTSNEIDPDWTSCSRVLSHLEDESPHLDEFDLDFLREHARDTRNDVSHYITTRGSIVTIDVFPEYYSAILEGVNLVQQMVSFLLDDALEQHRQIPDPLAPESAPNTDLES